MLAPYKGEPQ